MQRINHLFLNRQKHFSTILTLESLRDTGITNV